MAAPTPSRLTGSSHYKSLCSRSEQNNQLDVLVNNAFTGVNFIGANKDKKFWETEPAETWDTFNAVGLRNHYICTVLASRIMVANKKGLIVNVSSAGGLTYIFNVGYGVGKAACDRYYLGTSLNG